MKPFYIETYKLCFPIILVKILFIEFKLLLQYSSTFEEIQPTRQSLYYINLADINFSQ